MNLCILVLSLSLGLSILKQGMLSMNANLDSILFSTSKTIRLLWPLGLIALWTGTLHADGTPPPYPAMAPVEQYMMDREAEIAEARTAAPKSVADSATILTLGKSGFDTTVQGSNGFVCFVGRSWAQDFDAPEFWNPKIRTPQCWNAAVSMSVLPDYLKRTQWVLTGVSKDEMIARTKAEVAAHEIVPAPGCEVYMMSKDQYINDPAPPAESRWHPHVMFFVPATGGEEGSAWGANVSGAPVFSTTSDVEPVTTYFVVVPKWSDGALASYTPTAAKPEAHHH